MKTLYPGPDFLLRKPYLLADLQWRGAMINGEIKKVHAFRFRHPASMEAVKAAPVDVNDGHGDDDRAECNDRKYHGFSSLPAERSLCHYRSTIKKPDDHCPHQLRIQI